MVWTQLGSVLYVYVKFESDISIPSKVIRGTKISKFGHVTQATPLRGHFMVRTPEGCVLDLCTKFESDISIPSKVIRDPNIRKLGHVTRATPTFGSFYNPYAGRVHPLCLYQIRSR